MLFGGAESEAADLSLDLGMPPWCAKSCECRNEIHSAVVRNRCGEPFDFSCASDKVKLVLEPGDGGSGAMDIAFESIEDLAEGGETYGRDQPFGRSCATFTDIDHDGRSCAVSGFAETLSEAHLSGEGTMAVSENSGDGDRLGEKALNGSFAIEGVARTGIRHHAARNGEKRQKVIIPIERMDIEKESTGRVGVIGSVNLASGKLPDEPALDRTHEKLSPFGGSPGSVDIVEDPFRSTGGEIRVDQKTAPLLDEGIATFCPQVIADVLSPHALPYDRIGYGFSRNLVPDDDSLPLVRQGERILDILAFIGLHHVTYHLYGIGVKKFRIVLNPTLLGIDLGVLD